MGAAIGTPSIGLVYDPKVKAFAELAGFPTISSVTAIEVSDHLVSLMNQAWDTREATRLAHGAQRDAWRAKALVNAEIALELGRTAHARHA
jgi:polysaccharide pyruvyl transferase WcaK-like protein